MQKGNHRFKLDGPRAAMPNLDWVKAQLSSIEILLPSFFMHIKYKYSISF